MVKVRRCLFIFLNLRKIFVNNQTLGGICQFFFTCFMPELAFVKLVPTIIGFMGCPKMDLASGFASSITQVSFLAFIFTIYPKLIGMSNELILSPLDQTQGPNPHL
ncbi:hypothetical protein OWV82_015260 [Melia azedarach]|uniref:Uncharacterized protein n=1 Tax=Melia azedarach TaxID=155640 RepID=A0ACC1XPH8_MELAZ|nr:hypothetical protein OWV82_015260 [Melia azedarach]